VFFGAWFFGLTWHTFRTDFTTSAVRLASICLALSWIFFLLVLVPSQYNQKYVKGRDGHDWLLRKNIWRRMRYRRENKKMVERLRGELEAAAADDESLHQIRQLVVVSASAQEAAHASDAATQAAAAVAKDLPPVPLAATDQAAIEAAVAAAETFGDMDVDPEKQIGNDNADDDAHNGDGGGRNDSTSSCDSKAGTTAAATMANEVATHSALVVAAAAAAAAASAIKEEEEDDDHDNKEREFESARL
jgi:hypothetical protein